MNLSEIALAVSFLLTLGGLALIILRRSLIFYLLGVELLFNAAMLIALVAGARWNNVDGQVLALFLMALSGGALAPTLALAVRVRKELGTSTVEGLRHLREGKDG